MKFVPVHPLTRSGRVWRSIILVSLLIGSLFPSIGGIGLTTIASPLALVVVLYEIGRRLPKLHPVLLVPFFFLGVGLHAMAIPTATPYGEIKLDTWFTATLLTAVAASLLRDERSIYTFARTWLIAAGLLSVITVLGFAGGRGDGFDSNPIWLARAMATGLVMALFLVMQRDLRTWVFVAITILLVVGIFATGSRGPILAVGVGAIALVVFTRRHRIRRILGIAVGAGVSYWAVTVLPFFASSRIVTLIEDGDNDASRSLFWSLTTEVIRHYPEGVGIGNWSLVAGAPRQFFYPHNMFLEVFAELGIWFGCALIVVVMANLIKLLTRSREMPIAILVFALIVTEAVQISVSGDLNARTFWFLMALGFFIGLRAVIPSIGPTDADEVTTHFAKKDRFGSSAAGTLGQRS